MSRPAASAGDLSRVTGPLEAEESLRRLARALIASALEVYELERLADASLPPSGSAKATSAPAAMYSRRRKKWGRAA
jgi:uncharacterized protein (DUF2384 family)